MACWFVWCSHSSSLSWEMGKDYKFWWLGRFIYLLGLSENHKKDLDVKRKEEVERMKEWERNQHTHTCIYVCVSTYLSLYVGEWVSEPKKEKERERFFFFDMVDTYPSPLMSFFLTMCFVILIIIIIIKI